MEDRVERRLELEDDLLNIVFWVWRSYCNYEFIINEVV